MKGLDLFCGAGGASAGYMRCGHDMTGVDWRNQPRYPGKHFLLADFRDILHDADFVRQFDFVHASPPCQIFSPTGRLAQNVGGKVDHLTPTLDWAMNEYSDMRWVIENVPEAPLPHEQTIMLCGSQFPNLRSCYDSRRQLRRHRKFWLNGFQVPDYPTVDRDRFKGTRLAPTCRHNGIRPLGVYGHLRDNLPGGGSTAGDMAEASALMGIDWMIWTELREAIPPDYTEFIGVHL